MNTTTALNVQPFNTDDASAFEQNVRAKMLATMASDTTITQAGLSRQLGVSESRLSQWLRDKYPGDNEEITRKVAGWQDNYEAKAARAEALPADPAYVATPTSERVIVSLRYAHTAADMALVYGQSGLGKTEAVLQYQKTMPNIFVATMTPASASVVPALEVIAEAVGVGGVGGGAQKIHRAICKRLRNTKGLLVIDEANHLSTLALEQIRSIYDDVKIGVALVGNKEILERMTSGHHAKNLDRLYSRIGKRDHFTKCTKDDVSNILDAWAVKDQECRRHLADIASKPGALRTMSKVLRLASMYAAAQDRGLSLADVRAAGRELAGAV